MPAAALHLEIVIGIVLLWLAIRGPGIVRFVLPGRPLSLSRRQ
jgi:hypothetical protein